MILAYAVVLGLAASLASHRGRTFNRIAAIPLHSAWLAVLALVLQLPLLRAPMVPSGSIGVQMALYLASLLLLLAFVWRNRRLVGVLILGAGVICNLLVIVANGGFMPITPETLVEINPGSTIEQWPEGVHYGNSKDVIHMRENTRLWVLSDVLVSPPLFSWPIAFSVGDLLIAAGIVVLLQGSRTRERPVVMEPRPSHGRGQEIPVFTFPAVDIVPVGVESEPSHGRGQEIPVFTFPAAAIVPLPREGIPTHPRYEGWDTAPASGTDRDAVYGHREGRLRKWDKKRGGHNGTGVPQTQLARIPYLSRKEQMIFGMETQ